MIGEIIKKRVSTRSFGSKPVPEGLIHEAIETARYAPSGKNRQPWRIRILGGGQKNELLSILCTARDTIPDHGSLQVSINAIEQCSSVLLVLNPYSYLEENYSRNRLLMDTQSIGAFIQSMLLLLTEKGVASLWINDVYFAKKEIEKHFEFKDELIAAIAVGYSDYVKDYNPRLSLDELLV